MRLFLLSFSFLYAGQLFSQQVNGNWKGIMYFPHASNDTLTVELMIKGKNNQKLWGYSICHFKDGYFAQAGLSGKYDSTKQELYLRETKIDEKDLPEYVPVFLDEYYLNFDQKGKLTGMARCIKTADNKHVVSAPCHEIMYIDLIRK